MSHRASLDIRAHSSAPGALTGGKAGGATIAGASGLDVFAGVTAFLLPVAISPELYSATFVPKLAVLLVMLGAGLPLLIGLARRSEVSTAARAAGAFLVVGLVSALVSKAVLVGIFGLYTWGTGWLFWCAVMACWAIGTSVSTRGVTLIGTGLLAGVAVNALVAIAQVAGQLHTGVVGLYQGQADGLMGNPIHLEALLLGGLGILAHRVARGELVWLGLVALASGALELSGERFALLLLAALVLYVLARFRSRAAAAFTVVLGASYGLAWLASSTSLHSRITRVAGTSSNPRLIVWKLAFHSLLHHVVLGVGPGETRSAISAIETPALARRLALGEYFADAHNIVVEIVVTTGLVGLACIAVFVLATGRRARGDLVAFALLVVAVEMIEPLNVATLPLAALALGAAGTRVARAGQRASAVPPSRSPGVLRGILVGLAVVVAGVAIAGDVEIARGQAQESYPAARLGSDLLAVWSAPAALTAEVANYRSFATRDGPLWSHRARDWYRVALTRDPTDPGLWFDIGEADVRLGQTRAATAAFEQSLRWNPSGAQALTALGILAEHRSDWPAAAGYFTRAVAVSNDYGPAIDGLATANRHRP